MVPRYLFIFYAMSDLKFLIEIRIMNNISINNNNKHSSDMIDLILT